MLSALMVILLLIVLAVLLVLLVLFTAIDIIFEAKGSGSDIEHSVTVHWLLFSKQVSPTKDGEDEDIHEEIKEAEKFVTEKVTGQFQKPKKEKKSRDLSFSEILQAFRQLKSPAIKLLQGMIHAIRIPYARVNMVFGFHDPAYTGIAYGYAHALKGYFACHSENLKMQLEPDFIDSRLDLDMKGAVRIRLYRFILVILFFVLDRNVLRFSWQFLIKRYSKRSSVNL